MKLRILFVLFLLAMIPATSFPASTQTQLFREYVLGLPEDTTASGTSYLYEVDEDGTPTSRKVKISTILAVPHNHVASQVTSGVFDIARIPDLSSLYGGASSTFAASQITSGTLDGDRLPGLSATKRGGVPATGIPNGSFLRDDDSWVTVSPTAHVHAASEVTSGTLDGDRLPAMSINKQGAVPPTGGPTGKFLKDDGTFDLAGGAPGGNDGDLQLKSSGGFIGLSPVTGKFPLASSPTSWGVSPYSMPSSIAAGDILFGSNTNVVGVISKGGNNSLFGINSAGVYTFLTSLQLGDSQPQIYGETADTGTWQVDLSASASGKNAKHIYAHTLDRAYTWPDKTGTVAMMDDVGGGGTIQGGTGAVDRAIIIADGGDGVTIGGSLAKVDANGAFIAASGQCYKSGSADVVCPTADGSNFFNTSNATIHKSNPQDGDCDILLSDFKLYCYKAATATWVDMAAAGTMVYPGAGVPNSTGTAWDTSYTVGTSANNLVKLDGSAKLPAVDGAALTGFLATQMPAAPHLISSGSPVSVTGTYGYFIANAAVEYDLDTPAAGHQFCFKQVPAGTNVVTVDPGTSKYLEKTDGSAYCGSGEKLVSGGENGDQLCIVGYDSTHWTTWSYRGTWTCTAR